MSDTESEVIKAIGKEIYSDMLQPIAKSAGKILGEVGQMFELLSPVPAVNFGLKKARYWLANKIDSDLSNLPESEIIYPNPIKLKQNLEGFYSTCDDELLRNLFAELISNSFQKSKQDYTHPAYPVVLQQLTSWEAILLSKLATSFSSMNIFDGYIEMNDILDHKGNCHSPEFGVFLEAIRNKKLFEDLDELKIEAAWNNLNRLEILQVVMTTEAHFREQHAEDNQIIPAKLEYIYEITISISTFGYNFLISCGVLEE